MSFRAVRGRKIGKSEYLCHFAVSSFRCFVLKKIVLLQKSVWQICHVLLQKKRVVFSGKITIAF